MILNFNQRLNAQDRVIFLRQFATLLTAGIPIIQSCDLLERSQVKTPLRLLIYSIKRDILSGKTLFQSLKPHSSFFDELTLQLIHIGECTGKIDKMLALIAKHQEKKLALKKQIQQALFYPCLIALAAIGMTFCLLIFVIPQFADIFHDVQDTLPFLTRCVFYLSDILQRYGLFILGCFLLVCYLIYQGIGLYFVKHWLQQGFNQLPFISTCAHKMVLAQFTRNLAITFNAGIPLIDALGLAASTCHNKKLHSLVMVLRNKVKAGLQLHQVMSTFPYFPHLMVQMVKIGEEAGKLEQMLDKTADFFEVEVAEFIDRSTQLLEPLIMVVLGVLIGGLVISMYLPIFKVGSAL